MSNMNKEKYINKSYKVQKGPYQNFECTVKNIKPAFRFPEVKLIVDISVAGRIIEVELEPEYLGLSIEQEPPQLVNCPHDIIETFIHNSNKHSKAKEIFNHGATREELDLFSSKLDIKLPDTFYTFYKNFNGTKKNEYFSEDSAFLSLNNILKEKNTWDYLVQKMETDFNPLGYNSPQLAA